MSTTVDKQVLEMQLKNQQFEQNAAQTLNTIQRLKSSFNFSGIDKSFSQVEKTANDIKFDRLASSIENIQSKFSLLNVAAMSVFNNIVNKALAAGKNLVGAFTIEPMTSGFSEYEAKLGSIQTILANTASRQKEVSQQAIEEVNKTADASLKRLQESNAAVIEDLQETQAAQDKALQKSFQAQNKAFEKNAQAQMKSFEKQASAKLEAFEKETEKETEALNKNYEERFAALDKEQNEELTKTEETYSKKYDALVTAQKEELDLLESSYAEQTKAYEKEMKQQTKDLQAKFDEETKALEKAADEQVEVLKDQQEEELKALEKTNKEELKVVTDKYDEQLKALKSSISEELDVLEDNYDQQVELVSDSYDEQLEALEDYYDEAFDALEDSQEKEMKLLEENHDAQLDMYHEEYMEKLKVADEDRYNKIKALDDEINSIKGLEKAEKAEREEAENRRKLQELESAVQNASSETERIRAANKLAEFQAKLAEEQAKKEREAQIASLEAQKDQINEEYELRKEQYEAEYEQRKENENEIYKLEKENLKDVHEDQKDALKDEQDDAKKTLKKSVEDQKKILKEQYDYEKELVQQRLELQQEQLQQQKEAEVEALKEQQEAAKELLKDQQEDRLDALKEENDARKEALKEQQELEKDALQEQQELQKESIRETYEIQREALVEQQELQKESLKNQNDTEKQAIQESFDARRSKLSEQQNAEMTALTERRNKERETLNDKIESEREALNDRIDAEREALKDQQDAQQEALDRRQKAELKAIQKSHEQKMKNIEIEKNAQIANLQKEAGYTEASSLEEVNDALDELNKYADQTIYNFQDMTHNIGTFTAAGVGLEDSVTSIKGIANLAALSGSNAQQASTAMYQLSQAISAGSLKLEDWNSVVNAGMGGAQFREALKETARAHGIEVDQMIAKQGSFRASLQEGWITSEVLLETLSKFTGDLTDEQLKSMGYTEEQVDNIKAVAQNAVDAATKVRTWSQLIDTTKEAMGSGWTETFEIIFGDFDQATEMWTKVSEIISGIIDQQADARNQLLTGWAEGGGRDTLLQAVSDVWEGIKSIAEPIREAFKDVFPPATAETLINITKNIQELTSKFKLSESASKNLRRTFKGLFSIVSLLKDIVGALVRAFSPVGEVIGTVAGKILDFTGDIGEFTSNIVQAAEENGVFRKGADAVKTVLEQLFGVISNIAGPIVTAMETARGAVLDGLSAIITKILSCDGPFETLGSLFESAKTKGSELFESVSKWVSTKFEKIDTGFLSVFRDAFSDMKEKIEKDYGGIGGILSSLIDKAKEIGTKASGYFSSFAEVMKGFGTTIANFAGNKLKDIIDFIKNLATEAKNGSGKLGELYQAAKKWVTTKFGNANLGFITDAYNIIKENVDPSKSIIENIKEVIKAFKDKLSKYIPDIGTLMKDLSGFFKDLSKTATDSVSKGFDKFIDFCKSIPNAVDSAKKKIQEMIDSFKAFIATFTTRTVTIERSQGAANYGEFTEAVFSESELDEVQNKLLFAKEKIEETINWLKENVTLDDVMSMLKNALKVVGALSAIKLVKSITSITDEVANTVKSVTGITDEIRNTISKFGDIFTGVKDAINGVGDAIGEFTKSIKINNYSKISKILLTVAVSVMILAKSVKELASIEVEDLVPAAITIGAFVAEIGIVVGLLSKYGGEASISALAILAFAEAINIMAKAVIKLSELDPWDAAKGAGIVMASLAELAGASWLVGKNGFNASAGVGLLAMASSLMVVQKAVEYFAKLDVPTLKKGGLAAAAAITVLSADAFIVGLGRFNASSGAGMVLMASSLLILQKALAAFGDMQIEEIGRGFAGLAAGLIPLTIAVNKAAGSITGAAALSVASVGLIAIAKAVQMMEDVSLGQVGNSLAVFAGVLGTLVIAAAAVQPYIAGLLSLSVAIGAIGLAAIGIGAGLTAFVASLGILATTTEASLTAVVAAFGVLAWGVLEVIQHLIPQVGDVVQSLILTMCDVIQNCAPTVAETVLTVVVAILDVMIDYVPMIVDKLYTLIMLVLDQLKIYLPDIIGKVVEVIVAVFDGVVSALREQDTETIINAIIGIMLIEGMMKKMAALSKVGKDALIGIAEAGLAIVELGAILAAIGALAQIPGLVWLMGEGSKILEIAGHAIGIFIGAIIGGILNGISAQLPAIALNLCSFITNLQPFLEQVSMITTTQRDGVVLLLEIITLLTAATIIDSIGQFFSLPFSYARMGAELTIFGESIKPFIEVANTINASAMQGVKYLAETLILLTAQNIIDGLTSWFTGGSSLSKFGEDLAAFGPYLKQFAKDTEGINAAAVEGSANALKILSEAADTVPNSGGVLADWVGDNTLDDFGAQLEAFGPHLAQYAKDIKGISGSDVEGSANALKILADAADTVPNSGGKLADWIGDNTLDTFGAQLELFGPALKSYSDSVAGVSAKNVTASANALTILSRAAAIVPNTGGLVSFFTGDNTLDTFGTQLKSYGESLAAYSDSIKDVKMTQVTASAMVSRMLVDMANNVPASGGILQAWFGEKNLETFGSQLIEYGKSIKAYNDEIQGIGVGAIIASASAGQSLVSLANNLPEDEGFFGKLFGGDKDLGSFGSDLEDFGGYIYNYYEKVKDITDTDTLNNVGTIASRMINLAVLLKDVSVDKLATLGKKIKSLGEYEKKYYNSINDMDTTKLDNAITSIQDIIDLATDLKDLDTSVYEKFGTAMGALGEAGVEDFVDAFEDSYDTWTSAISTFVGDVSKGITDKKETVGDAGEELGANVPTGLITGMNSKARELNDGILAITSAIKLAFSNNLKSDDFKTIGSDATNGLKTGFSSPGRDILSAIKTLTGGLVTQFQNGLSADTFKNIGKSILNNLKSGIGDTTTRYQISTSIKNLIDTIKDKFSDNLTYDNLRTIGANAIDGLRNGLEVKAYLVNESAATIGRNAVTSLSNNMNYTQGHNAAVNFINGITEGIGGGSIYVTSAVASVADAATKQLNTSWDINSPSKVSYEAGSYYIEGIVQALIDGGDGVSRAVEDLTDKTNGQLGELGSSSDSLKDSLEDVDSSMSQTYDQGIDLSESATDTVTKNSEEIGEALGQNTDQIEQVTEVTSEFNSKVNDISVSLQDLYDIFKSLYGAGTQLYNLLDQSLLDQFRSLDELVETTFSDLEKLDNMVVDAYNSYNTMTSSLDSLTQALDDYLESLNTFNQTTPESTNVLDQLATALSSVNSALDDFLSKVSPLLNAVGAIESAFINMQTAIEHSADKLEDVGSMYSDKQIGSSSSSSGGLDLSSYGYSTGSGTKTSSKTTKTTTKKATTKSSAEILDSLASSVSDNITDAMRDQPVDLEVDLTTGKTTGTLAGKKSVVAGMGFGTTTGLVSGAISDEKAAKAAKEQSTVDYKSFEDKIKAYLEANGSPTTANITNTNTFNIKSTDAKQSAKEIGVILQRQAERSKAVWAS